LTRDDLAREIHLATTYQAGDTVSYLLTEDQVETILLAADEYAAHVVEECARPHYLGWLLPGAPAVPEMAAVAEIPGSTL
jgi:hypothetical protein